jgi:Ca-activated chloride channel family protein
MERRSPLFLFGLSAALAALLAVTGGTAHAAGLLVADGGLGGVLEIAEHDVQVTINNGVAVTEVTQVFRNTEDRALEALYTFPVPKGASVSDFRMWIGGKEMVGEVVESRRARRIYESYKQRNVDPGLLEQVDHKTFEMRVFPVPARGEQRVRLTYYQELDLDHDWATYVYPLATTTRRVVDTRTHGRFALTLSATSEVPIVQVGSPSHADEFVTVKHGPHDVQASLEATGGDLGRDVVLAYRLERGATGVDLVASREEGQDGYVQLTLTAGDELGEAGAGMDYVFVLDVSGSMGDDGKLATSRGSLDAFVTSLGEGDRFDVMVFNLAPRALFGALKDAGQEPKASARSFLASQRALGGTVLEPALRAAYRYKDADRPLNVVLLSDGMTEQREREILLRLIGERPPGTRVFAVGVGNDVNRPLLEQLAEEAGGLAAFLSRGDDFVRQAAAFRRKLVRPAMENVEIDVVGGGLFDLEPRRLPNLHHGTPVRVYGRYREAGPLRVTVRGDVQGQRQEGVFDLTLPAAQEDNPEIERMWAWHRVQRLLKEQGGAPSGAAADEIVRLGEGWSIVTPLTSFLVLESDAEYVRWKIERRNVVRSGRDRAAQDRARERVLALRDATGLGPLARAEPRREGRSLPAVPAGSAVPDVGGADGGAGAGAVDPLGLGLVVLLAAGAALRRRGRRDAA